MDNGTKKPFSTKPAQPPQKEKSTPINRLSEDLLRDVFSRLDLPSRVAVLCVCKRWQAACSDSSLWCTIRVPHDKAFRVWDSQLATLVRAPKGRLTSLDVSGSGVTGKSLIRILQANALAPVVKELRFDNCCNLKLCDILAFVQALAPTDVTCSPASAAALPASPDRTAAPPSSQCRNSNGSSSSLLGETSRQGSEGDRHAWNDAASTAASPGRCHDPWELMGQDGSNTSATQRSPNVAFGTWPAFRVQQSNATPPGKTRASPRGPPVRHASDASLLASGMQHGNRHVTEQAWKQLCPAPLHPSFVERLHVDGCKQMGLWEVQMLQSLVGHLDVSVCACGRIGVLDRCTDKKQHKADPTGEGPDADMVHAPGATAAATAAATTAATTAAATAATTSAAGGASQRDTSRAIGISTGGRGAANELKECAGLCGGCQELFKGCGVACGACCEPRTAHQALQSRLLLWQARRRSIADLRARWTNIQHGFTTMRIS